ncbi:endospore germination permease [Paenibacillus sp. MBLB4367]|uniref:GerAB/ArcD/ProY family transporter n=1 Tax=Paenibacillus sp. MBLB4367 TaxID=3384767 RepID=UPI0039081131
MPSEQISQKQLMFILVFVLYGTVFITMPRELSVSAQHSGWIGIVMALLICLLFSWMVAKLASHMGNQDFVSYCRKLLGPWIGSVFTFVFLLVPTILFTAFTGRILIEMFVTLILPETPIGLLLAMELLLRLQLVHGGLNIVGRWGQFVMPGVAVILIALYGLAAVNVSADRILPLSNGTIPGIMEATFAICGAFTQGMVVLFIWNEVKEPERIRRSLMWTVALVAVFYLFTYFITIGNYGIASTQRLAFPVIEMIKDLSFFDFIEHLEAIFLAVWIFMNVTKGGFSLYVSSIIVQQWCGLQNYRKVLVPLCVIIYFISLLPQNMLQAILEYEEVKGRLFVWYAFGVVGFLLLLSTARRKLGQL